MKHIFKFLLLIINILAVASLLLSGYGGHISPLTSSLPGIALMIFPIVLVGVFLLLILDLLTWRRLAFLPAFAILACATPIWNFCPLNISNKQLPPDCEKIKILSYNVHEFINYKNTDSIDTAINTILATDADIVCMQESSHGDPSEWVKPDLKGDSIVTRFPYRIKAKSAISVWSRYPIEAVELRQSPDPTCVFQCVKVNVNGTHITLYNIHLQSLGLSDSDKELYGSLTRHPTTHKLENARNNLITKLSTAMKARARQALLLRSQIDSIGGANIVVAGDFNDIEDCYAQRVIEGNNLQSTFTMAGFGPTLTYHADRFYFNIDHILYSSNIKALGYERIKSNASDHYPIIGTFAIARETSINITP